MSKKLLSLKKFQMRPMFLTRAVMRNMYFFGMALVEIENKINAALLPFMRRPY